jgi:DHA1 family bicyclomycin/chloramphenicol resistance-like MFS transporter
MFRAGLWIQFAMAVDGGRAAGCRILVAGDRRCGLCWLRFDGVVNAMAVIILDEFPHMAGTASSLAGTFRFGIGAIIGALLSMATFTADAVRSPFAPAAPSSFLASQRREKSH